MVKMIGINCILLDIEGTTCPVSFVKESLFLYADNNLESFMVRKRHEPGIKALIQEVKKAWRHESDPEAPSHLTASEDPITESQIATEREMELKYLRWLMQKDKKLSALKELQGMIWREGYTKGELKSPLFEDVAPSLRQWSNYRFKLAVYSSGSVDAQKLLYQHSCVGDLRFLFQDWFDTNLGRKINASSYMKIAKKLNASGSQILFISDSTKELEAAYDSKFRVLFSNRPGNPESDPGKFEGINSLSEVHLERSHLIT